MGDLVERLRSADMNSQQRVLGSRIFGEAADEITRLRAALADAQAVGFAAGVEAAAEIADRNRFSEISGSVSAAVNWVSKDISTAIRALTPPDLTAAAARVLLDVWPTDASFDAAFNACVASYHDGDLMQDEMDRTRATVSAALRALTEKTS